MNPTPCPTGYYTYKTTASSLTECILCPPGKVCSCTLSSGYCTGDAIVVDCTEGYLCSAGTGALASTPNCPTGYYCPTGTIAALPCPQGKVCDGTGNSLATVVDCP